MEGTILLRAAVALVVTVCLLVPECRVATAAVDGPGLAVEQVLHRRGILHGYPDGSMLWNRRLSRAEAIKMAVASMGMGSEVSHLRGAPSFFKDVTPEHWAAPYIAIAWELGLIRGYPDGTLRPDSEVTTAEYAVILSRMCMSYGVCPSSIGAIDIGPKWAANEISRCAQVTYALRVGAGSGISLDDYVSRSRAAVLLFEVLHNLGTLFDAEGKVTDVDLRSGKMVLDVGGSGQTLTVAVTAETTIVDGATMASMSEALLSRQVGLILDRNTAIQVMVLD